MQTTDADIAAMRLLIRDEMSTVVDASGMICAVLLMTLRAEGLLTDDVIEKFRANLEKIAQAQEQAGVGDAFRRTLDVLGLFAPGRRSAS